MGINNCICGNCGGKNEDGDVFCRYCGKRLYCGNRSQNHGVYDDAKERGIDNTSQQSVMSLESLALNKADLPNEENSSGINLNGDICKNKIQGKKKILLTSLSIAIVIVISVGIFAVDYINKKNKNETTAKVNSAEQVETEESNLSDMIELSKESLQPYMDLLGVYTEDDYVDISPKAYENSGNVYFMGEIGSVSNGFVDGDPYYIRLLDWESNEKKSKNEYEDFIDTINDYMGYSGVLQTDLSSDYSGGGYVWLDDYNPISVIAFYKNNRIVIRWYYND